MKEKYVLLKKEYSEEDLYDLERDVSEIHDFPKDAEYKRLKNDDDFKAGTYLVTIVYVPGDGDRLEGGSELDEDDVDLGGS